MRVMKASSKLQLCDPTPFVVIVLRLVWFSPESTLGQCFQGFCCVIGVSYRRRKAGPSAWEADILPLNYSRCRNELQQMSMTQKGEKSCFSPCKSSWCSILLHMLFVA